MQFSHKDASVLDHCKHKEQTEHLHFKNSSDYDPTMNVGFINEALPVKEVLVSGDRGQKMRWNHVTRNLWMPRKNEQLSGKPWTSFTDTEPQIFHGFSTALMFLHLLFLSCLFFFGEIYLDKSTVRGQCMTQSCCLNSWSVRWTQSTLPWQQRSTAQACNRWIVFAKKKKKTGETFTTGIVCREKTFTSSVYVLQAVCWWSNTQKGLKRFTLS